MKINAKTSVCRPGKVKLSEWPTLVALFQAKEEYQELLKNTRNELSKLQKLHYASSRYALLLIFQGMDSAGKDGAMPTSCRASIQQAAKFTSFKQPSAGRTAA